jgi:hypothetical protein
MQIKTTVKVSELKHGDTVEIDGNLKTVSRDHLKKDELFGYTFQGDPHRDGITKVVFKVPTAFGFRFE